MNILFAGGGGGGAEEEEKEEEKEEEIEEAPPATDVSLASYDLPFFQFFRFNSICL